MNSGVLFRHVVATESDGGNNDRQLRLLEFLADVVDQIDQVRFVFRDGLLCAAVFMALEPSESSDFIALPLIARNHFVDLRQRFFHALDH